MFQKKKYLVSNDSWWLFNSIKYLIIYYILYYNILN